MLSLQLLSRPRCCLCDEMYAVLEPHIAAGRCVVEVLDIDRHPDLLVRFGSLVPVLLANGREIAHYSLSEDQLSSLLTQAS